MSSTTTFLSRDGFHYALHLTRLSAPHSRFCLKFSTRWSEAKQPDEERIVLRINLTAAELQSLVAGIESALAMEGKTQGGRQ